MTLFFSIYFCWSDKIQIKRNIYFDFGQFYFLLFVKFPCRPLRFGYLLVHLCLTMYHQYEQSCKWVDWLAMSICYKTWEYHIINGWLGFCWLRKGLKNEWKGIKNKEDKRLLFVVLKMASSIVYWSYLFSPLFFRYILVFSMTSSLFISVVMMWREW